MPLKINYKMPSSALFVLNNQSVQDLVDGLIQGGYQKEPFYILNLDTVYDLVENFREKLPRVQIFYAMKSNDQSMMLKIAIALGLGFDCASPGEIYTIRKYNVCPTSIIYAMPAKTAEQMAYARQSGVRHTTFDSPNELKGIKQYWPDARLLIRLKIDSDCIYKLGDKFGCEFKDAFQLLDEASQLGLTVNGVAFHVGSGCFSKDSYMTGLQQARALFDYERSQGREMTILDIGGGFINNKTKIFDEVSEIISKGLDTLFPEPDVQVIAEPGRYLCESAFTFYNNIIDVQTIKTPDRKVNLIYSNNALNGTLRYVEPWHTSHRYGNLNEADEVLEDSIVYGPTADETDHLEPYQLAPCSPKDWLVHNDQGAYSLSFNSRLGRSEDPPVRCVVSLELWNKLKTCSVFDSIPYLINPDWSTPLPSSSPPLIPDDGDHQTSIDDNIMIY